MRRNRRTNLRRFSLVAAAALLLAGCMGGGGGGGDDTSDGVIRIASAETDAKAMEALTAAGAEYEEQTGTKVVFEAIPLTDIYTKVNATYGTSAEYNAFITGFVGHISLFQGEDKLVPVDDIVESLGGKEDFYNGDILFPIENKTYWIPFDYNIASGFIRQDWLDEAGLEVPTNWNELREVVTAFDERSAEEYGMMMPLKADDSSNWITSQVLWANNVRIFDDEWNVILDSPEMLPRVVESLELLVDLHEHMPPQAGNASYPEVIESFVSGQSGITFYSGRLIDVMNVQAPDAAENVASFGFPMADGEGVTAGLGYDGLAVMDTTESEETLEFVQWFYENKLVDLYASAPYHYLPAQKSVYESEEWRSLPTLDLYWEQIMEPAHDLISNENMHSIDTDGPSVDLRSGEVFQSMLFPEMYQRVTLNGEDPAAVVKDTAKQIRELTEN